MNPDAQAILGSMPTYQLTDGLLKMASDFEAQAQTDVALLCVMMLREAANRLNWYAFDNDEAGRT